MTEQQRKVLNKLADYLAKRDHSIKELYEKLALRFEHDDISWAINEANELGWLLPADELAEKVTCEMNRKQKSHRYTQVFLQKKGLPTTPREPEVEKEKALSLLMRKFHSLENLSQDEKKKAYNYLAHRGYDRETIYQVIYENK